ncbi:MAG: hypothetical protein HY328_00420 [Chloroflexi bacterium]|nr:hypothetical protein [Chloroflexota bacterium]
MTERSNTTAKLPGTAKLAGGITGRGFVKGDPRINRKGRPKTFDALRSLAQTIAHEAARDSDGGVVVVDGHAVTVAENVLRQWAASDNAVLQMRFFEVAFGKIPQGVEISGANVRIDVQTLTDEELLEIVEGGPGR